MARIPCLVLFVILVAGSAGQAWADLAPGPAPRRPEPPKVTGTAPVTIYVDRYLEQSRIEIPRRFLDQTAQHHPSAVAPRQGFGSTVRERTVLAGVTLSLLLVGGGLVTVLVRRRQGRAAVMTSVALLAVLSVCVSVSLADLVPPSGRTRRPSVAPRYRGPTPQLSKIEGSLVILPVENGDRVTLRIGRDLADKLTKATPTSRR